MLSPSESLIHFILPIESFWILLGTVHVCIMHKLPIINVLLGISKQPVGSTHDTSVSNRSRYRISGKDDLLKIPYSSHLWGISK